jgi:hypothetical protein
MTKSNPFYALSACAMLLGCWMLSDALHLVAGHLKGLLVLMLVLQLYEGLLVGLGAYLVRSGRARHDGLVVLLIESIFLMDATLLSAECVTADLKAGTAVAAGLVILAVLKLAWVRSAAPALLSRKSAIVLGAHAAFILAVPVAAAQLAVSRLLTPLVLYAFWWLATALPAAQQILRKEAEGARRPTSDWPAVWAWMPTVLVALHLWTVGYIHTIDFRRAFVAPFLLGLTATLRRESFLQQLILPSVAALVSLGAADLSFNLLGSSAVAISPRVLAVAGACVVWAWLAWRHRNRWLALLAGSIASVGLFGLVALDVLKALLHYLDRAIPRDIFGWGTLVVIASFVLLAVGFRRSLSGDSQ